MTGIAFDVANGNKDNAGITSSLSWSHTSTGTNLHGEIAILGDNITGGNDDITSVTWGAVTCSLGVKYTTPDIVTDRFQYLYPCNGIASGSQTITITAGSTHFLLGGSSSYSGVCATGNPVQTTSNTAAAFSGTLTTSLTTTIDNSWTFLMEQSSNGSGNSTAGTGLTRRMVGSTYLDWEAYDSGAAITPFGSYSMTTNMNGGDSVIGIIHIVESFQPDPCGASPDSVLHMLNLLGIGR